MALRDCEGCTACCTTHPVKELPKEGGNPCNHCWENEGCAIYERRPASCRAFRCAWLEGLGRDEDAPRLTGIVADYKPIRMVATLILFEASPGALRKPYAQEETRKNIEMGNSVIHVPLLETPKMYLPFGKDPLVHSIFNLNNRPVIVIRGYRPA